MQIEVKCQACGRLLIAKAKQLGKTVRCPACAATMTLPAPVALGPRLKSPPPVDPVHEKREAKPLPSFAMACPSCGSKLRLLEKYRGVVVTCPDCDQPFTAEERTEPPPAPPPR
jgi:predicted RNA-binding Zn-ribbon protein involved in translation (DUF1610 family)